MLTVSLPKDERAGPWHRKAIKAEHVVGTAPIQFLPAKGLEIMNVYARELK